MLQLKVNPFKLDAMRDKDVPSDDEMHLICMDNLLANSEERVYFKDRQSRFLLVSQGWLESEAPGCAGDEVIGKTDFDIFTEEHAAVAFRDEQRIIRTGEPIVGKIERETFADRLGAWVSTTKMALRDAHGQIIGTFGISRDVTAQIEAEKALEYQALHDSLTGLPNRALILDRIAQSLSRTRRSHLPCAVMFLDIDDFKDINDTMGHQAGDELLVAVGARLTATLREGDTAGRLGGDEFIVLIEESSLAAGVKTIADRLLEVLAPPFAISASEVPITISASIGVASSEGHTADELLRDADIALYQAKAAGKRSAVVFAPSMQAAVVDQRRLKVFLNEALAMHQFFLQYQPTIDLQTNKFTGVEALLRWRHPERGVVQPDGFIPALESSGLIIPVGAWVLEEACRQGATWHAQGHNFSVSVNVSGRQLEKDRIVEDVRHALAVTGFEPSSLILELTETVLVDDVDSALAHLSLLKALGICLAIDDFGAGYSSLAYLRQFPIDVLKIDRSFISGISDSATSTALVRTFVQLGKILHLETVAEGIEDDDQRLRLQAERVDTGQGFFFSRPLDVDRVDEFLRLQEESSAKDTQASTVKATKVRASQVKA